MITQERLKELFDEVDGQLVWKVKRQSIRIGQIAGNLRKGKYRIICVDGHHYMASHLLELMRNGIVKSKHDYHKKESPYHKLYKCWAFIKSRCYNSNCVPYKDYGGRGITIAEEWRDDPKKFIEDLLTEIGPKPVPWLTLDRIDNNGNYEPGNIRWATRYQQIQNRRPYKKSRSPPGKGFRSS